MHEQGCGESSGTVASFPGDHSRIQASFGMFVLNFPDARSFFPGLAERGGPQIPINLVAASK